MSLALDGLLFVTGWLHVLLAPYTKVEESFNLHATHDVLMYGIGKANLRQYDHFVFPGAVPRTFVGSVLLAWISLPVIWAASVFGLIQSKLDLQIAIRLTLASVNAFGLCLVRRAVSRRFGRLTSLFFTILTCSQFHVLFWMGRTIPNIYAFFLVNLATFALLNRPPKLHKSSGPRLSIALSFITFATVVFRGELALLLAPLALKALSTRSITFKRLIMTGLFSGLCSLLVTVVADSYFWDRPFLWPEFSGLYFNVVKGKSAEWGVSPPLTYFTSFLPKLLLSAFPLSVAGMILDPRLLNLLLPSWVFIGLISFLGHKEWRFIIYVVPVFNIAAASTCRRMVSMRKSTWVGRFFFLFTWACIVSNFAFTLFSAYVSSINYPGGEALHKFHLLYTPETTALPVHVHISNLAAQTGASLFLHDNALPTSPLVNGSIPTILWVYNKTEALTLDDLTSPQAPFTHLILETNPTGSVLNRGWKVVDTVGALEGVKIRPMSPLELIRRKPELGLAPRLWQAMKSVVDIRRKETLWILERL